MKIVFVIPSFKTGGGNRVFIELANILCTEHNISIIAPNNSTEKHTFKVNNNISIQVIGKPAHGKISKLCNLISTIIYINRKHNENYVIISDPFFSLFSFLFKCRKLYRFMQADDYRIFDDGTVLGKGILLNMYKKICLYSYKCLNLKVIFNSHFVYRQFCVDSKRNDISLLLVHPAINHDIFNNTVEKTKENNKISICLVARKHPSKGIQTFLNVFKHLKPVYRDEIDKVVMLSHDDLSMFDTSGISIVTPRSDNDISEAYKSADIFISTSWREGFGLPPLEAMACGCAVICSDSGGVNEYARINQNCLMFEPKNEFQLRDCLEKLINNRDLRTELADGGLETSKNFTWSKSAAQLIKILTDKY